MTSKKLIARYKTIKYWRIGLSSHTWVWRLSEDIGLTDEEKIEVRRANDELRAAMARIEKIFSHKIGKAIVNEI